MGLPEKLKFIRSFKSWTQEDVADKLGISTHAYAKIERGETDVNFSRLQQIAEVMEIELSQLFGLDEKNIFNFTCDNSTQCQENNTFQINSPSNEQIECQYKLEKANLIIEEREKEIEYLKQQMNDLRDVIYLLKNQDKTKK